MLTTLSSWTGMGYDSSPLKMRGLEKDILIILWSVEGLFFLRSIDRTSVLLADF